MRLTSFLAAGGVQGRPGDVLGSGTAGNGCGLESLRLLAGGDVVELEMSGIGTIRNRVRVQPPQG